MMIMILVLVVLVVGMYYVMYNLRLEYFLIVFDLFP